MPKSWKQGDKSQPLYYISLNNAGRGDANFGFYGMKQGRRNGVCKTIH